MRTWSERYTHMLVFICCHYSLVSFPVLYPFPSGSVEFHDSLLTTIYPYLVGVLLTTTRSLPLVLALLIQVFERKGGRYYNKLEVKCKSTFNQLYLLKFRTKGIRSVMIKTQ